MTSLNSVGIALELTKLIGRKDFTRGVILENEWAGDNNPARFFTFTHKENSHHQGYFEHNGKERKCAVVDDKKSKTNVIGHPATLTDLHRWMNEKMQRWEMDEDFIYIKRYEAETQILKAQEYNTPIPYDSSKDLLDQDEETLKQIVELVKANSSL